MMDYITRVDSVGGLAPYLTGEVEVRNSTVGKLGTGRTGGKFCRFI